MGESLEPVLLKPAQRKRAAKVLTEAFQDDPLYRVVEPDDSKRRRMLLWLNDRVFKYGTLYGTVHTLPDIEGVACWLPPGRTDITVVGIVRAGFYAMPLRMGFGAYQRFNSYIDFSDRLRGENDDPEESP